MDAKDEAGLVLILLVIAFGLVFGIIQLFRSRGK